MAKNEIYLAGTMSGKNNYGLKWRNREKKWFETRGEQVFSPPDRENELLVKYDIKPSLLRKKNNQIPPSVRRKLFAEIIKFDLDQLRYRTKYAVFYFTEYSPGTVSELTWCFMYGIPVYLVTRMKLKAWPEACTTKIFRTFEQLRNYLKVTYGLRRQKTA